jgi:hypothetical protein
MVDALRVIASEAHPELSERIKWNAPSFALGDEDRITLGVSPAGGVRVVLHRGAKMKDGSGPAFDDLQGLAAWPAPDRGVVKFTDLSEIEAQRDELRSLFERWLAVNS